MGRVIGSIKAYVHCKMPSCKLKINNISNKYLVLYNSSFNFPVVKLRSATEVMRSLRCQRQHVSLSPNCEQVHPLARYAGVRPLPNFILTPRWAQWPK